MARRGAAAVAIAGLWLHGAEAILPSGVLSISRFGVNATLNMLVSPSHDTGWGPPLPQEHDRNGSQRHVLADAGDACSALSRALYVDKIVVAHRGNCSFLEKAKIAQSAGAAGLIVRNTREAVYLLDRNRTTPAGNFSSDAPMPAFATDCSRGEGYVPYLDPIAPWLVQSDVCSKQPGCTSRICLPTGHRNESSYQVCCMWDTHLLMGANYTEADAAHLQLPIVFATVTEGETLTALLATSPSPAGTLYARYIPLFNLASIALWAIGVATAIGGSYYAARADRARLRQHKPHADPTRKAYDDEDDDEADVLHLSFQHAIGFIVVAGCFLTFLYFVHVGPLLSLFFGLSSISTTTLLLTLPMTKRLCPCMSSWHLRLPLVGTITIHEVLALSVSTSLVVAWFLHRDALWSLQDLFGIALCFVFLKTIRLPNLKIGALLLLLAFAYDIFFVFVSPLLFGRSVMVDVATGGPPAAARDGYPGRDYCERYPTYPRCVDPDPLPMLLVFPRVGDWRDGRAMLGLGDIVLPGLLLTFALRFDYTRRVHLKRKTNSANVFFGIAATGYALGLGITNVAVVLMNMGQPALLYLVPCTLGSVAVAAHATGDLPHMWHDGLYEVEPMAPIVGGSPVDYEAGDEAPLLDDA
ncbi:hypothetical protein SDRG_09249 [Saprolegnia diclina VS20]|uniref:PA domain-containing protein n=1 Tax=Saprolegnia diclina (strain VS20) TaxID=1156394 RepID=T0RSS2_SAPDV|nr:hypothetical protein SDRG_09249 [Saprolegnia diclina VS20]EQC33267.1 hypothetical protein SDRG_09249 [Saprolegnia diclina VS20]|eukprot:XP_008613390.1 hypothetical protein SDRG_09249 [Saprolegnia diclina VS20]